MITERFAIIGLSVEALVTSPILTGLEAMQIRRPMFPLDPEMEWSPKAVACDGKHPGEEA